MLDDPGHANNNRQRWSDRLGSLAPGARPKRLWLAFGVIGLLGAVGVLLQMLI